MLEEMLSKYDWFDEIEALTPIDMIATHVSTIRRLHEENDFLRNKVEQKQIKT